MKTNLNLLFIILFIMGCNGGNQSNKNRVQDSTEKQRNSHLSQTEINYCDCQVIQRDDGTNVTQCVSLPVASDNILEFGMALASNGQDEFLTVTLRFFDGVKGIAGNLSIRLKDNNLLTLNLVNKGLSYIGNTQVAQGVFDLDEQKIERLKSSELLTVSLRLDDNMVHTLECNSNTSLIMEQLICLIGDENPNRYYSKKYHYEIILPENFKQTQATGQRIDLKLTNVDGTSILINVSDRLSEEYNITAHDYSKEFFENTFKQYSNNISVTKAEKIYIDNNKAFLIHYVYPSKSIKALEIYFFKEDNAYVLTATAQMDNFSNYEKIFLKILKSLKFKK